MRDESYSVLVGVVNPPPLLSAWSVTTTLADWLKYPHDLKLRTVKYAMKLPYKDSPRSKWEGEAVR